MCGRYTLRRIDLIRIAAGAEAAPDFDEFSERPRYNVAPGQLIPIIRMEGEQRLMTLALWGLIPSWQKEMPKIRPINARAETLSTSGMFRQAFARRRCLIPADGFYEWQAPSKTAPKQPHFIHLQGDRPFAFAGLWERWQPPEQDKPIDTCTIITTEPNSVTRPIHNRMPVILPAHDYAPWLNPATKPDDLRPMLIAYEAKEMEAYRISDRVNRPANDGPELIEAVA